MYVHKCDLCKKEIKDPKTKVTAGAGWDNFEFCPKCGLPVAKFLVKHKLKDSVKMV